MQLVLRLMTRVCLEKKFKERKWVSQRASVSSYRRREREEKVEPCRVQAVFILTTRIDHSLPASAPQRHASHGWEKSIPMWRITQVRKQYNTIIKLNSNSLCRIHSKLPSSKNDKGQIPDVTHLCCSILPIHSSTHSNDLSLSCCWPERVSALWEMMFIKEHLRQNYLIHNITTQCISAFSPVEVLATCGCSQQHGSLMFTKSNERDCFHRHD